MVAYALPKPALALVEREPLLRLLPKQHTLGLAWDTDATTASVIHRKLNRLALTDALVWKRYKLVYVEPLHYSDEYRAYFVLYYRAKPIAIARVHTASALDRTRRELAARLVEYGFDDSAVVVPSVGCTISAWAKFHHLPTLCKRAA